MAQGLTPTASGSLIVGSEEALGRSGPGAAVRRGDSFALANEQLVRPSHPHFGHCRQQR